MEILSGFGGNVAKDMNGKLLFRKESLVVLGARTVPADTLSPVKMIYKPLIRNWQENGIRLKTEIYCRVMSKS